MSIRPLFTLFPPHLKATSTDGRRSEGPLIIVLQLFLRALSTIPNAHLESLRELPLSGVYDDDTVAAVKAVQTELKRIGEFLRVDGNFDPYTRKLIAKHWGLDDEPDCSHTSWWADDQGNLLTWPPDEVPMVSQKVVALSRRSEFEGPPFGDEGENWGGSYSG